MPPSWFSLRRSLYCKSDPSKVHDPKTRKYSSTMLSRKITRSGCSRSVANLKDVIYGSNKTYTEKPPSCSPRSMESSEFLNPLTHEVALSNSSCELKITGFGGFQEKVGNDDRGNHTIHCLNPSFKTSYPPPRRKSSFLVSEREGYSAINGGVHLSRKVSLEANPSGFSSVISCHKCGEQFTNSNAAEAHHLSHHAVTELVEGDSSRKIVEIICRGSWLMSENQCGKIDRVLKVQNKQKTLAQFEEYREMVKIKASKLPKRHPRCLADGNELLRFYGTTVACKLGLHGSTGICDSRNCCACRIIRHGFTTKTELKDGVGVFTTSTSARAFESIEILEDDASTRKALIVCRVIAGRVHRPLENVQEIAGQAGFDSLAGKVGLHSNIEELYLLNPKALLPCFVVICKT